VVGSIHVKVEPWVVKRNHHHHHGDHHGEGVVGVGVDSIVEEVEKVLKEGVEGLEEVTVQVEVFDPGNL